MLARAARALPRRQLSTAVPSLAAGDDMGKLKPNEIGVKMLAAPFADSGKGAAHPSLPRGLRCATLIPPRGGFCDGGPRRDSGRARRGLRARRPCALHWARRRLEPAVAAPAAAASGCPSRRRGGGRVWARSQPRRACSMTMRASRRRRHRPDGRGAPSVSRGQLAEARGGGFARRAGARCSRGARRAAKERRARSHFPRLSRRRLRSARCSPTCPRPSSRARPGA